MGPVTSGESWRQVAVDFPFRHGYEGGMILGRGVRRVS